MKIHIRKHFGYMAGTQEVKVGMGVYRVPEELNAEAAKDAVRMGAGVMLVEKVAPENKVAAVPENKAKVERKVRRRSAGAKSDE